MTVYLGRDRQRTAQHLTATHTTVSELTKKIQGRGHKLYMDNYFSSPDLFDDLATKQIYCCGIVRPNRKGMPQDLGPKRLTLQWGDLQVQTRGDLTAILWRDKRDIRVLTNIYDPTAEGNFCDNNNGKAIKLQIVVDYNHHMGYVDKGDRMAKTYSINHCTWKWTKKLFFHLFDLAILNSYILFSSLGGKKISLRDFRMTLMRNLVAQAGQERNVWRPVGETAPAAATQSVRFEERGSNIGLFRLPREEDVVCVRSGVSPEKLQWYDKGVVLGYVAIAHAFETTTTRHILETFQAIQVDLPT